MTTMLFSNPTHSTIALNFAAGLDRLEREALAFAGLSDLSMKEAQARIDTPFPPTGPVPFAHTAGDWVSTETVRMHLLVVLTQARHLSRAAAGYLAMTLDAQEARDRFQSERRRCSRLLRFLERARALAKEQHRLARGPVGHNLATFDAITAPGPFSKRDLSPWLDLDRPAAPRPRRF